MTPYLVHLFFLLIQQINLFFIVIHLLIKVHIINVSKTGKKIIRKEQPIVFYLDTKMYTNNSSPVISEAGIQKQFGKFIAHLPADAHAKVRFSALNPERLAKYNETAKEHNTLIIWQEDYAKFLSFFLS